MGSDDDEKKEVKVTKIKNLADLQRLKLDKLMKNPEKPVIIPERIKPKSIPTVPDFVRNVMGSSAGAGSGEFHVYRHLRRKEYARQKFIKEMSERERLQMEYQEKIETNRQAAEEKTAKKRAKRLKKKAKQKSSKKRKSLQETKSSSEESESASESENEDSTEKAEEDVTVSEASKTEDISRNVGSALEESNNQKTGEDEVKDVLISEVPKNPDDINISEDSKIRDNVIDKSNDEEIVKEKTIEDA